MLFELDKKYQITHAWYRELLGSYQLLVNEPRAEKLHFKPDEPRLIVEIGVYEGASTCWWSDNFMDHPSSRLISIDPFTGNDEYRQNREKFPTLDDIELIARTNASKSKNAGKIDIRKGCSWDLFPALNVELKQPIDILYIDGEHTPNAVCRDLALYYPLLRSGGALILDDYGHEDVQRGIDGALTAFADIESAFKTGWQLWCVKK
jgi:predicted O-methyltransferase YrrM